EPPVAAFGALFVAAGRFVDLFFFAMVSVLGTRWSAGRKGASEPNVKRAPPKRPPLRVGSTPRGPVVSPSPAGTGHRPPPSAEAAPPQRLAATYRDSPSPRQAAPRPARRRRRGQPE